MKHKVFGRKLSRNVSQRSALLRNLSSSVLLAGFVVTTEAKAKFVKGYLEKLIRNSQKNSLAQKRKIASAISPKAFERLIKEISPAMSARAGGYTRIIRLNQRHGDGAQMAKLELVSWNKPTTFGAEKPKAETKSTRQVTKEVKKTK